MNPGDRLRDLWRDRRLVVSLGFVALVGLGLRLWYFFQFKRRDGNLVDEGDAFYYGFQAVANAEGDFFVHPFVGEPAADHPPVTSLFLTPVAAIFGDRIGPMRLAMTALGTVTVVVVGVLGHQLARRAGWSDARCRVAGVLAAGVAAVNASLWMNDVLLMSETPGAFVIACLFVLVVRQWGRPSLVGAIGLGALLGLGVLTRAEFGLYAVLLALPLYLGARTLPLGRRLVLLASCAAVSMAVVAPWVAWNQTRFEEPVLISTNDGLTIVGANCPRAYFGDAIGFWLLDCALDDEPTGDQSQRSKAWRDEGLEYIGDNVDRLPAVAAARLGRVWGVYEPRQMVFLNGGEGREGFASWIGMWQLWLLAPVAALGTGVLRRHRVSTTLVIATVAQVSLTAVAFYGIARFRIAADVLLCALAAIGIAAVGERVRQWATSAVDEPAQQFVLGHRPSLDGVRAVAVLAVLGFHAGWGWFGAGFLGVDLFFVLSGFLITALLLDERARTGGISLRKFWARRALRLLPAAWAVVVFVVVAAAMWEDASALERIITDGIATVFYVANWKLVADNGVIPELLDHAWSLAIEEQFYVVWPIVVAAALAPAIRGASTVARGRVIVALASVGVFGSFALRTALSLTSTSDLAYYATFARADGLLLGAGVAGFAVAFPHHLRRASTALAPAALAAFAVLVIVGGRGRVFDVFGIGGAGLAGAVLLVGLLADDSGTRRILGHPVLRWVGARSYGLYLWHWPIFLLLRPSRVTDLSWWQLDAVRFALAFAVTAFSYRVIERPFLARKAQFAVRGDEQPVDAATAP